MGAASRCKAGPRRGLLLAESLLLPLPAACILGHEAMGEVLSPRALAFGLMLGAMMLPELCLAIDCDCKP